MSYSGQRLRFSVLCVLTRVLKVKGASTVETYAILMARSTPAWSIYHSSHSCIKIFNMHSAMARNTKPATHDTTALAT